MENIMNLLTSVLRYALPAAALIMVLTCVISLFRNRPRVHKMAQLTDQTNGDVIDIDHWETSIGKSKSNDIVLPLPSVSRFHAVISKKSRDWVITDTFSKNGITVNGKKIEKKATLEDGDVIKIGSVGLKFECADALSSATKKQIRSNAGTSVAYAVLVDVKTRKPLYLKRNDVLIGRGEQCDIRILADTVSSEHARIYKTTKGWAIRDLDSHNGTQLNGRFLTQTQLIFDEDTVTFGDRVFIFYEK
ncbi:MAG: FHA domain-containing protein [Clostridiales bacterium]|nr:FHA domain-containing protein [Clostridiales bacterium]